MESEPIGLAGNRFSILASKRTPLAWIYLVFCFLKPTMDSCIRIASLHDKEGQAKCQTQVFPAIGNYLVSEDF
jgi:hypothetical protein